MHCGADVCNMITFIAITGCAFLIIGCGKSVAELENEGFHIVINFQFGHESEWK